jgi:hypothetical protein
MTISCGFPALSPRGGPFYIVPVLRVIMRHIFAAAALAFLAFVPFSTASAAGASDPFTVSNIPVQAKAASAVEAQNIAINSGKARAWQTCSSAC